MIFDSETSWCFQLHFFKKGHPRPLLLFIFGHFKQKLPFLKHINVKNVHPVYGAGIRTHNLWNMILLP